VGIVTSGFNWHRTEHNSLAFRRLETRNGQSPFLIDLRVPFTHPEVPKSSRNGGVTAKSKRLRHRETRLAVVE